jgi:Rps23 Pro-64 3,4-dihydroxylase Tpa1-like proline 4-hydroxylase
MIPSFKGAKASALPFPHFQVPAILAADEADQVLAWLRTEAPWNLRVESFYEQHEFSLLNTPLGSEVADLVGERFVETARRALMDRFETERHLDLVDVSAHRLTPGQTIRVHNDFIGEEETHRLLIQLNGGWSADRGGLLMLFADERPESVKHIVMPTHGSGFAFEISPKSFHAVSTIRDGERYTLVYTFRRSEAPEPSISGH